jgi:hypothetical protein
MTAHCYKHGMGIAAAKGLGKSLKCPRQNLEIFLIAIGSLDHIPSLTHFFASPVQHGVRQQRMWGNDGHPQ